MSRDEAAVAERISARATPSTLPRTREALYGSGVGQEPVQSAVAIEVIVVARLYSAVKASANIIANVSANAAIANKSTAGPPAAKA